jgi:signal transduction histidine kinase
VALQADITAGLTARMPDGVLEQVVDNLIDNAVEACRDGGAVHVTAVASGPDALIEVSDDGQGMTDDDKQHAFDRFWRAPTSRAGPGPSDRAAPRGGCGWHGDSGRQRRSVGPAGDGAPAPGFPLKNLGGRCLR